MDRCPRRQLALRRQARRRRRRRDRRLAAARPRCRPARAGRADRERRHRRARRPVRRAHDVPRSGRRRRAPPRGDRRGVVRGVQPPPRLGVRAAARARPLRGDPRDRMRARARRSGQHRPLVVERDSRRRWRAVPRAARRARARRRLRERGGGRDRRRPDRRRHLDPQARRRGCVVRRPRASCRSRRVDRRHDRRRRCLRGRLARRRAGAGSRRRRPLRAARRIDAGDATSRLAR